MYISLCSVADLVDIFFLLSDVVWWLQNGCACARYVAIALSIQSQHRTTLFHSPKFCHLNQSIIIASHHCYLRDFIIFTCCGQTVYLFRNNKFIQNYGNPSWISIDWRFRLDREKNTLYLNCEASLSKSETTSDTWLSPLCLWEHPHSNTIQNHHHHCHLCIYIEINPRVSHTFASYHDPRYLFRILVMLIADSLLSFCRNNREHWQCRLQHRSGSVKRWGDCWSAARWRNHVQVSGINTSNKGGLMKLLVLNY